MLAEIEGSARTGWCRLLTRRDNIGMSKLDVMPEDVCSHVLAG